MGNHRSKQKHDTSCKPPEIDLALPTQATFNDGESSFKRTPDNSCKPPELDLILPAQATFNGGQPSLKRTPDNSGKPPLKLTCYFQHRQHSMMEDQLSRKHLTTAANPPEVDLTLPTQASFNDGQSSFKRTPDNSCNPPLKLT